MHRVMAMMRETLKRMPYGMSEIERLADTGLMRVLLDNPLFHPDRLFETR